MKILITEITKINFNKNVALKLLKIQSLRISLVMQKLFHYMYKWISVKSWLVFAYVINDNYNKIKLQYNNDNDNNFNKRKILAALR